MLVMLTAGNTGQTKEQTEATLRTAFDVIRGAVARGETVRLPDFGTFEARRLVDDVKVVRFSPAEEFQKEVNHW